MTFDPQAYWDERYRAGSTSGAGSEGDCARLKASVVNWIIAHHRVKSVIDWGCGDGEVLKLITREVNYTGIDASPTIIQRHKHSDPREDRFKGSRYFHVDHPAVEGITADMALSLDVLFHFPDDESYRAYLNRVFASARRVVLIHATNHDGGRTARHVRWRRWEDDVPADWRVTERTADPEELGFYVLEDFR